MGEKSMDNGIDNAKFSDYLYRIEQMLDIGGDKTVTCSAFIDPMTDCELAITGLDIDKDTSQPYLTGIHIYSEEIPVELEQKLSTYLDTAITLKVLHEYINKLTEEQLDMLMKTKALIIDPRNADLRELKEVILEDVHVHSLKDNIEICNSYDKPITFMCSLEDFDFANNWERE